MVDMDASHILLGMPWKFDVDVRFRDEDNSYIFKWDSNKIDMIPQGPTGAPSKPTQREWKSFLTLAASKEELEVVLKKAQTTFILAVKSITSSGGDESKLEILKEV